MVAIDVLKAGAHNCTPALCANELTSNDAVQTKSPG